MRVIDDALAKLRNNTPSLYPISSVEDLVGKIVKLSYDPEIHPVHFAGIEPYALVTAISCNDFLQIETASVSLVGPFKGMFLEKDRILQIDGFCAGWVLKKTIKASIPVSIIEGVTDSSVPPRLFLTDECFENEIPDAIHYSGEASKTIQGYYNDLDYFSNELSDRITFCQNTIVKYRDFLPTDISTSESIQTIVQKQLRVTFTEASLITKELPSPKAATASFMLQYEELESISDNWGKWQELKSAVLLSALAQIGMYAYSGKISDRTAAEMAFRKFDSFSL